MKRQNLEKHSIEDAPIRSQGRGPQRTREELTHCIPHAGVRLQDSGVRIIDVRCRTQAIESILMSQVLWGPNES